MILFFIISTLGYSQNLVPNPGFETVSPCPNASDQFPNAAPWQRGWLTPDAFNTCGPTPMVSYGTCTPNSGTGMMGLFCTHVATGNDKEYATVQLSSPLPLNSIVTVSFYARVASAAKFKYTIDNIGCYFTSTSSENINYNNGIVTPHVETPTGVFVSTTWTQFTMTFTTPNSGPPLQYMTIGNFNSNANTSTSLLTSLAASSYNSSYIFLDDFSVTADISTQVIATGGEICSGTCIPISATTINASGAITYTWQPGNLTGDSLIVCPTVSTIYTVTANDANGNSFTDTCLVSVLQNPDVDAGNDVTICSGSSATLTASGVGSYLWNTTPTQVSQSIVVTPTANTQYILTLTNGSCVSTDVVNVIVTPLPLANAGSDVTICLGGNAALSAIGTGSYSWNTIPLQTTQSIIVSPTVTTQYQLTVSNGLCFSIDTVEVALLEAPIMQIVKNDITCHGLSNGTATATISGGTQPLSFAWNPGNINANSITNLSAGTYTFTVNDAVGCNYSQTINITQPAPLTLQIIGSSQLCAGASTSLSAQASGGNAGYNYDWHGAGPNSNMIVVSPLATTIYDLTVIDPQGCESIASHLINVSNPPIALFSGSDTLCVPFNTSFINQSQNALNYTWLFGDGTISNFDNPTHGYNTAGIFNVSLVAESANGCKDTFTINNAVLALDLPINSITSSELQVSEYDPTVTFNFESSNAVNCNVDFGDGSIITLCEATNYLHTYKDTGSFCAAFTSENTLGCKTTNITCIKVLPEFEFYIPNSFTPDGDGINDVFTGYGANFTDFSMMIYNRWGETIYESHDYEKPWDGLTKNKSSVSQVDIYMYRIELRNSKELMKVYTGNVNLIK